VVDDTHAAPVPAPASSQVSAPAEASDAPEPLPLRLLATLAAILVAALAFGPSIGNGFVYDDVDLIEKNDALPDPARAGELLLRPFWAHAAIDNSEVSAVYGTLYRPVVMAWFLLLHRLAGFEPLAWHAASVALHLLCVGLAAAWLRRRFVAPASTNPSALGWDAFAIAVGLTVFAVHPTRGEAVGWLSGATETCAAAAWLAALLAWPDIARSDGRATFRRLAAGVLFGAALLAKESAAVAPVVLLLDEELRGSQSTHERPSASRRARAYATALVPAATVVAIRFAAYPTTTRSISDPSVLLGHLAALGAYARQTVAPWPSRLDLVAVDGTFSGGRILPVHLVAFGVATLVGLVALVVVAVRKPAARGVVGDLAYWLLPLIPALAVVAASAMSLAAERFLYLPMLGISALAVRALRSVGSARPAWRPVLALGSVVALAASTFAAQASARRFESDQALARAEVEVSPLDPIAWQRVARAAPFEQPDLALEAFARAHRLAQRQRVHMLAARILGEAFVRATQSTPDHDDAALRSLLEFCDAVNDDGPLRFRHLGQDFPVEKPAIARAVLRQSPSEFGAPCAFLHLRVGDTRGGLVASEALARDFPDRMAVQFTAVLLRAMAGDLDGAAATLTAIEQRGARRVLAGDLRARLDRARRTRDEGRALVAQDPSLAPFADAQVALSLGSIGLARRALQPLLDTQPTRPDVALLGARIEQLDRRPAAALALLEGALAASPPPPVRQMLLEMRAAVLAPPPAPQ
jgi:hypothetical protein